RVAPHSAIMDMARNAQVPAVAGTLRLDQNPAPEAIDQMLDQAEKTARQTGRAVIVSAPLPVVLDHLQTWLQTLPQRGIALAP
ncbi:divergent polysaccharide deacetylase family protein, partial [Listeria monocytogenes]|uniref:divergent polysaccharide deacetylase family protein n=1 Tax=Listeria monocytogenes TaxID=1639 RepID=UPI003FA4CD7B